MTKLNEISIQLRRITPGSYGDSIKHEAQDRTVSCTLADTDLEDLRDKFDGELDRFFDDLKTEKKRQLKARREESKPKDDLF